MYHSINPFGELKDAKDLGRQLAGMKKENNRIFYGEEEPAFCREAVFRSQNIPSA